MSVVAVFCSLSFGRGRGEGIRTRFVQALAALHPLPLGEGGG